MALDRIGHRNLLDQPAGEIAEAGVVLLAGQHRLELVAAEPADLAVLADHRGEALRDLLEQGVADRVAERVVDVLEAVEVDQEERAAGWPLALLCSASSSVRRISERLGRPVSESYLARRLISSSERRCWVRSVPMPRKPRKRPYSSKLGVPESDHQISAAVLARTLMSVKGSRVERWKPSVRSEDLVAAPVVEADQVGEGLADQLRGRGLEVGGELLGDVGEGAARRSSPRTSRGRPARTPR